MTTYWTPQGVHSQLRTHVSVNLTKGKGFHVQRFRGGLVFKAHILCVALNSRLESIKEEKKVLCDALRVAFRLGLRVIHLVRPT